MAQQKTGLPVNSFNADIARKLEHIEAAAWADRYAAAPSGFAKKFGLAVEQIGGITLFALRESAMTLYNRSLGLGVHESAHEATVQRAIDWLGRHCGSTWGIPVTPLADLVELTSWLSRRGLTLSTSGIAKFVRLTTPDTILTDCPYDIRLVCPENASDFAETATQGFDLDPVFACWFAQLCGRAGWKIFAAYDGHRPVGVGAMFVQGEYAWFGTGATLPEFRHRGVQRAILNRRIAEAKALGVRAITVDTFHAGSDEAPNDSHRNVLREGFTYCYLRRQFVNAQ
ncbi:GNAT family N-acetyltransferase [Caballeronia sp. LjRoot34]|uniref:GNAT family N-acetyltransferase n=1 Tax=Caballeronia sp. LjRoot34 TaxID=3342325 RepID=UPI003ECEF7D0